MVLAIPLVLGIYRNDKGAGVLKKIENLCADLAEP